MYEHIYKAMIAIYNARSTGLSASALDKRDIVALDAVGMTRHQGDLVFLHEDGLASLQSEAEDRGEWAALQAQG